MCARTRHDAHLVWYGMLLCRRQACDGRACSDVVFGSVPRSRLRVRMRPVCSHPTPCCLLLLPTPAKPPHRFQNHLSHVRQVVLLAAWPRTLDAELQLVTALLAARLRQGGSAARRGGGEDSGWRQAVLATSLCRRISDVSHVGAGGRSLVALALAGWPLQLQPWSPCAMPVFTPVPVRAGSWPAG